jgi:hypothetical protein
MAGGVESHKCQVAIRLDFADLFAIPTNLQIFKPNFIVSFLAGPFEGFGPGMVT